MKRLFETAELEAELFGREIDPDETSDGSEIDLENLTEEAAAFLENVSDEEMEGFPALELTLELTDGRKLEYELVAVFLHNETEYVGLHPKSDTQGLIHIMQMSQGENDELVLNQIEDDEELQAVYDTFYNLFEKDND